MQTKFDPKTLQLMAEASYKAQPPPSIGDWRLLVSTPTLKLYQNKGDYILAVRGTFDASDTKADTFIPLNLLASTDRYKADLKTVEGWKGAYGGDWYATGHSLGGAICDEFLRARIVKEAYTFNPAIQPKDFRLTTNKRFYAVGDPMWTLFGQYSTGATVVPPASILKGLTQSSNPLAAHGISSFDGVGDDVLKGGAFKYVPSLGWAKEERDAADRLRVRPRDLKEVEMGLRTLAHDPTDPVKAALGRLMADSVFEERTQTDTNLKHKQAENIAIRNAFARTRSDQIASEGELRSIISRNGFDGEDARRKAYRILYNQDPDPSRVRREARDKERADRAKERADHDAEQARRLEALANAPVSPPPAQPKPASPKPASPKPDSPKPAPAPRETAAQKKAREKREQDEEDEKAIAEAEAKAKAETLALKKKELERLNDSIIALADLVKEHKGTIEDETFTPKPDSEKIVVVEPNDRGVFVDQYYTAGSYRQKVARLIVELAEKKKRYTELKKEIAELTEELKGKGGGKKMKGGITKDQKDAFVEIAPKMLSDIWTFPQDKMKFKKEVFNVVDAYYKATSTMGESEREAFDPLVDEIKRLVDEHFEKNDFSQKSIARTHNTIRSFWAKFKNLKATPTPVKRPVPPPPKREETRAERVARMKIAFPPMQSKGKGMKGGISQFNYDAFMRESGASERMEFHSREFLPRSKRFLEAYSRSRRFMSKKERDDLDSLVEELEPLVTRYEGKSYGPSQRGDGQIREVFYRILSYVRNFMSATPNPSSSKIGRPHPLKPTRPPPAPEPEPEPEPARPSRKLGEHVGALVKKIEGKGRKPTVGAKMKRDFLAAGHTEEEFKAAKRKYRKGGVDWKSLF